MSVVRVTLIKWLACSDVLQCNLINLTNVSPGPHCHNACKIRAKKCPAEPS